MKSGRLSAAAVAKAAIAQPGAEVIYGDIRRQRISRMRGFLQRRWHLDEMYVKLDGAMIYLWRAFRSGRLVVARQLMEASQGVSCSAEAISH